MTSSIGKLENHVPMFPGNADTGKPFADDTRIRGYDPVVPPALIQAEIPLSDKNSAFIQECRRQAADILHKRDDRLLVVVGPCSLHDPVAALDYAQQLRDRMDSYAPDLHIIMRAYLEKPRTTVGWKGMINDPELDNTYLINKGVRQARRMYVDILEKKVGIASEMLDTISPQYLADLVCWGAIGARTTESQLHRELASGLSFPVGFKNATDGNVGIAIDAIRSASNPHHFLSVTKQGVVAIVTTAGNTDTHIILRGGSGGPNYGPEHVKAACASLEKNKLLPSLMVDCSHGNSEKDHRNQPKVAHSLAEQIAHGEDSITAVMIESNIHEGKQAMPAPGQDKSSLKYGVSITDACISLEDTWRVLDELAAAVRARRAHHAPPTNGSSDTKRFKQEV